MPLEHTSLELDCIKSLLDYDLVQSAQIKLEFLLNAPNQQNIAEVEYLYIKALWKSGHLSKTKSRLDSLVEKIDAARMPYDRALATEIYRAGIEIYTNTGSYLKCLKLYMSLYNTKSLNDPGLHLGLRDTLQIGKIYNKMGNKPAELVFLTRALHELPFADEIRLRIAEIKNCADFQISALGPPLNQFGFESESELALPGSRKLGSVLCSEYNKALVKIQQMELKDAINRLKLLSRQSNKLPPIVYAKIATCCLMTAEPSQAALYYTKARQLDPLIVDEMENYAHLLYTQKNGPELMRFGRHLVESEPSRYEGYLAVAKYELLNGDCEAALVQIQKGCEKLSNCYHFSTTTTNNSNFIGACASSISSISSSECGRKVELLATMAEIYLESGNPKLAELAAMEAYRQNSKSYRAVSQLVECLIQTGDLQGALRITKKLNTKNNQTSKPRSEPEQEFEPSGQNQNPGLVILSAKVLMNVPDSFEETAELLQHIISTAFTTKNNPIREEAISLLVSVYMTNDRSEDALDLLSLHAEEVGSCSLYVLYGDVLTITEDLAKASVYYNTALSIDPHNKRAQVGLSRIDELLENGRDQDQDQDQEEEERFGTLENHDISDAIGDTNGNGDGSSDEADSAYFSDLPRKYSLETEPNLPTELVNNATPSWNNANIDIDIDVGVNVGVGAGVESSSNKNGNGAASEYGYGLHMSQDFSFERVRINKNQQHTWLRQTQTQTQGQGQGQGHMEIQTPEDPGFNLDEMLDSVTPAFGEQLTNTTMSIDRGGAKYRESDRNINEFSNQNQNQNASGNGDRYKNRSQYQYQQHQQHQHQGMGMDLADNVFVDNNSPFSTLDCCGSGSSNGAPLQLPLPPHANSLTAFALRLQSTLDHNSDLDSVLGPGAVTGNRNDKGNRDITSDSDEEL